MEIVMTRLRSTRLLSLASVANVSYTTSLTGYMQPFLETSSKHALRPLTLVDAFTTA